MALERLRPHAVVGDAGRVTCGRQPADAVVHVDLHAAGIGHGLELLHARVDGRHLQLDVAREGLHLGPGGTVGRERHSQRPADLLVVNHHLLCADAAVRQSTFGEVIPHVSYAIVDEAHQLEDVATQYFGCSMSAYRVDDLVRDGPSCHVDVSQHGELIKQAL